jgi:acetyl esterase/lipase
VSPILAPNFENLAPALVITAEMDPLRDEGEVYAEKMNKAGSVADLIRVKGAPHTFMQLDEILEIGQYYNQEALRGIGKAFGVQPKSQAVS